MTRKCIYCGQQFSAINSRTFHQFPKNIEARQKWLNALNLTKLENFNLKTTHVCSDHFTEEDFFRLNNHTCRRRLRSYAIPKPNFSKSEESANISFKEDLFTSDESTSSVSTKIDGLLNENTISDELSKPSNEIKCREGNKLDNKSNVESGAHFKELTVESEIILNEIGCPEEKKLENKANKIESKIVPITEKNSRKRQRSPSEDLRPQKRIRFIHEFKTEYISRNDFASDEAWEKFMRFLSHRKFERDANYTKSYRRKKKLSSLKQVVKLLKEKEEFKAAEYLKDLPPHVQELLTRMKNKKPTAPFPPNLKTFARTLHFHSPAAYEAVRSSFLNCLPCAQTLNKWYCSKQYKPGISEEIINNISNIVKSESEKGKQLIFNLTFDEMYIKKHKEWSKITHSWKGLIDLGGQLNESSKNSEDKVATKALVFMLVNINGGFKAPVAHYLINSLTGDEKAILLKDLLEKLNENNINVVSVTFDGEKANRTACEALGANLDYKDKENFKPYFNHPVTSQPVYIFYDPCHCLKLIRNYFAEKGPIIHEGKDFIDWEFIKKLQDKQENENLHCACKIRKRHVNFYNEKQKVFLAAQVLSNSTSCALTFLEHDLHDDSFKNASPTANFCKTFNDIFDLLNVRNKFCQTPGRYSICKTSLKELQKLVDKYTDYIENLEINVRSRKKIKICDDSNNNVVLNVDFTRKSVTETDSVSTGFVGFIICLKNLYNLAKDLIEKKIVEYFLSYKLSQDHVEMFFSTIRRMNGFNNNPTTTQYLSAYKKIVTNNSNIMISTNANCSPLDETLLIAHTEENVTKTGRKYKTKKKVTLNVNDFIPNDNYHIFEHDYDNSQSLSSEYAEEIVKYIAGAVVRIVKSKVHCNSCCDILDGRQSEFKSKLIERKNQGGLIFASDDVNFICKKTEKVLRQQTNLFAKQINLKIITETLKSLPTSILNDEGHCFQQEPLMDHRNQLLLLIIQTYLDIRLKHVATVLQDNEDRIRMKNNKTVIFRGQ